VSDLSGAFGEEALVSSHLDRSFVPFQSSRDRIKRAQSHRDAIGDIWNSFSPEDLNFPILNIDEDGTGSLRCAPVEGARFEDASIFLGEMLYQLRAALDNAVYDSAILDTRRNPPRNPRDYEFPICRRPEGFDEVAYKIAPLSEKRRALIQAVQPYNIGKIAPEKMVKSIPRTLGILNDWARVDRHRKMNIICSWAVEASPKLRLPPGVSIKSLKVRGQGILKNDDAIATFRLNGFVKGMQVEANPDLHFDVAVDEAPLPCHSNDSLSMRTSMMIEAVKVIVRRLAEY
jgi:hypothetical protein